jgi:hypothetical protein
MSSYTDVAADSWVRPYAEAANEMGLLKGDPNGTFRPNALISRAEMRILVGRLIDQSVVRGLPESVAAIRLSWLVQNGELRQVTSKTAVTRREVVVIFNRLFERGPLFGIEETVWQDVPYGDNDFHDVLEATINHTSEQTEEGEWILSIEE